jgi:hypothetical protein
MKNNTLNEGADNDTMEVSQTSPADHGHYIGQRVSWLHGDSSHQQ